MMPLQFESGGHSLNGVFHPSAEPGQRAVLLCNPFGQEAVRVHRMQRVLAERLSRLGMPVLRFDYFGTGESEGDDHDGDLEQWRQDIVAADARLRLLSGCAETAWIGIRLGATLALQAAGQAEQPPASLLMWEPVSNGRAYLESLRRAHRRALAYSYGPSASNLESQLEEAIGFEIGPELRHQMEQLWIGDLVSCAKATTVLLPMNRPTSVWAKHQSRTGAKFVDFRHDFDWTAEEALNSALVPAEALRLIMNELGAES